MICRSILHFNFFALLIVSLGDQALAFFPISKAPLPLPTQKPTVVYGTDDRREISVFTHPVLKDAFHASAVMIPSHDLFRNPSDGTYSIKATRLGDSEQLCFGEPFAEQFAPGECTGFMVAPDVLLTAGHCVPSQMECTYFNWVFGFKQESVGLQPFPIIEESQIYSCKRIIANRTKFTGEDWALIQLDRSVPNSAFLSVRKFGQLADSSKLGTVGYPNGIPAKAIDNAFVRNNTDADLIRVVMDTFGGNSGSPLMNLMTGEVEGILVRGEVDFVFDSIEQCNRVKVCAETGCMGETVLRISTIRNSLSGLMVPELSGWF